MQKQLKDVQKILIINLAFIGDVLLSTPVARALRSAYPHAVIDMMVVPLTASIAQGNPYIDHVIVYDKRGRHKKIGKLLKLIGQLRRSHYDLAVSTNFAPRGAMLSWAAGIPLRAGYDAQHGGVFLTYAADSVRPVLKHEAENYLGVLKPLGIRTEDTSLAFKVSSADQSRVEQLVPLSSVRPLVLVCPVGSYVLKSWHDAGYAKLIQAMAPVTEVILIGGAAERQALERINAAADKQAVVLAGVLTLGELAALIARAKVLVTVDTGPMHIAQAVGTPVVALFGPTDPAGWGPRGKRDRIFYQRTDCSPCWGKKACTEHRCMTSIDAAVVIDAVNILLNETLMR